MWDPVVQKAGPRPVGDPAGWEPGQRDPGRQDEGGIDR